MDNREMRAFQKTIWDYYKKNKRDFAWRNTTDPYKILVSEVMLQQTQTKRVALKYEAFLVTFPTLSKLAEAPLSQVLAAWSGLGYNRRAKFLLLTAQKLRSESNGTLPRSLEAVRMLPGLGKATAASVLVFSYNLPLVFIETNIRRVFLHFFFPGKTNVSDKELALLAAKSLDHANPRDWYYALMDYGAMLGLNKKDNPNTRSKHYKKQSPFIGSLRQVRGKVVKLLLTGPASNTLLKTQIDCSYEQLTHALAGLIKEAIVEKEGKLFYLTQSKLSQFSDE